MKERVEEEADGQDPGADDADEDDDQLHRRYDEQLAILRAECGQRVSGRGWNEAAFATRRGGDIASSD